MSTRVRVVLIGGASHTGTSSMAARLAELRPGGRGVVVRSTDTMGRHPGRPWSSARPAAVAHWQLGDEALRRRLLDDHHRAMTPRLRAWIRARAATEGDQVHVIEGAALRPSLLGDLCAGVVFGVWLTAPAAELRRRVLESAGASPGDAGLHDRIEAFLARELDLDATLRREASHRGLPCLEAKAAEVLLARRLTRA